MAFQKERTLNSFSERFQEVTNHREFNKTPRSLQRVFMLLCFRKQKDKFLKRLRDIFREISRRSFAKSPKVQNNEVFPSDYENSPKWLQIAFRYLPRILVVVFCSIKKSIEKNLWPAGPPRGVAMSTESLSSPLDGPLEVLRGPKTFLSLNSIFYQKPRKIWLLDACGTHGNEMFPVRISVVSFNIALPV